jgi:hypothetical protein
MPTSVTVLCLVFLMTDDDYYADLDNATTEQAPEVILDILENQEDGLIGKQEWMESWPKQDNHCTLLSELEKLIKKK